MDERVVLRLSDEVGALSRAGRHAEAVAAADGLLGRLAADPQPDRLTIAARVLSLKASSLLALGEVEGAISVYSSLVAQHGSAGDPEVEAILAHALQVQANALIRLDRREQAIEIRNELITRFEDATEPGLRSAVAGALFCNVPLLRVLKRPPNAITVIDQVLLRFARARRPTARRRPRKSGHRPKQYELDDPRAKQPQHCGGRPDRRQANPEPAAKAARRQSQECDGDQHNDPVEQRSSGATAAHEVVGAAACVVTAKRARHVDCKCVGHGRHDEDQTGKEAGHAAAPYLSSPETGRSHPDQGRSCLAAAGATDDDDGGRA